MVQFKYIMTKSYTAGRIIPIHGHNLHEFVYYLKANGTSGYSKQKSIEIPNDFSYYSELSPKDYDHYPLSDNSFILIPPHILHFEQHDGDAQVITIGFTLDEPSLIESYELHPDSAETIKSFALKIIKEYQNKQLDFKLRINCLITEMLIEIKRMNSLPQSSQTLINDSIRYIDENYIEKINIHTLAQNIGYCADYYTTLFKKHTGCGPKEYIIKKRLQKAKELLQYTDLTIAQISETCGFQFSSQFTKTFLKYEKITPKQFRVNINKFDYE